MENLEANSDNSESTSFKVRMLGKNTTPFEESGEHGPDNTEPGPDHTGPNAPKLPFEESGEHGPDHTDPPQGPHRANE
ncbi:hypothetical protein [Nostoc sp. 'Peltigera membranacea cyanobiont' 232]|uniref:hypothetical protein n=1 Tax=Nostoc sp. 'Peltigera membranacea cyanobiont' 232 TaxID=2014531 RepID=UPI000B953DC5|nr:hypothetical protein [Nostoc sp. 'Peltigera membranacea cyanobiont' 232]OYE03775.1 hypothetical protein CDG79_16625 [Nostoc sp. 'Peltigera membranacea cyanobiont' 232]